MGMAVRMIDLLPPSIADDDFVQRFVAIFDRIGATVAERIEHADDLFDFALAPIELVRLMASWVNLFVPPAWSEAQQRSFVIGAVALHRWRGTARGMRDLLQLATGCEVVIEDPAVVTSEPLDAVATPAPVTIRLHGRCTVLTRVQIDRMVRAELPVGVAYDLVLDDAGGLGE